MSAPEPYKIIKAHVDERTIAEEFLIREFIKIFYGGNDEFYDQIRQYVREYTNKYSVSMFWRLVSSISEGYMQKNVYRMLRGALYDWSLEEVPLENLTITMLSHAIPEIMDKADNNAKRIGEIMRKLPVEERNKIMESFHFSRDNYPVLVHEYGDKLLVHDGSRRVVNASVHGMETVKAYVGRLKPEEKRGKPVIPRGFLTMVLKIWEDSGENNYELLDTLKTLLINMKKIYYNAANDIDEEMKHFLNKKDPKVQQMAQEVLDMPSENWSDQHR